MDLHKCLEEIGVRYLAPGDASRMPDAAGSFDLTFSMTVLEHVTRDALRSMFGEAHRVLGPNGWAAHMIDPSDHFAHQDRTITRINFLRFSGPEWMRLAGNEYAYCNRLRAPEFERTLTESGFRVEHVDRTVDERSVIALGEGFPLHGDFQQFTAAELCTTNLEIYAHR